MSIDMKKPDSSTTFKEKLDELTFLSEKIRSARLVNVNLDNERQKCRESMRNIKNNDIKDVWVFNGRTFLKTNKENGLKILENDTATTEAAINQIKEVIKKDTDTLLKLKGEKGLEKRGFDLKPLVRDGKLQ